MPRRYAGRPTTSVMEFRLGASSLPERIAGARHRFTAVAAQLVLEDLESEAPFRHISDSAYEHHTGHTISAGYAAIDAKAQDRGAYITPKNRKALRFADGSFRMSARLKPKGFFERVEAHAPARLREAFSLVYGRR